MNNIKILKLIIFIFRIYYIYRVIMLTKKSKIIFKNKNIIILIKL